MDTRLKSFLVMVATGVASGALFWLLRDHWRHALGLLPYGLFLACPAMHLFMHHGHGQGHQHDEAKPDRG